MSKEPYHSRVYTDRPPYADFDAPAKFTAIESIFGDSYRYRQAYNDYKSNRMREEAELKAAEKIKAQTPPLFLEE